MMPIAKIITILALLALCNASLADELLVPSQYPTIQSAINAAVNGDTIIVAPGTYTGPGNRDIDFLGKAITVRSTNPNDPNIVAATIVDCNGGGPHDPFFPIIGETNDGFYFHNNEDINSIVEGFTIIRAYTSGIYCEQSSPKIKNCIISENYCGIYCHDSNSVITGCKINDNTIRGISCTLGSPLISDCNITGTLGYYEYPFGRSISFNSGSPNINNCIISNNNVIGIYCNESNSVINNCTIRNNNDTGIYCYNSNASFTGCIITGNSADYGGGVYCDNSSPAINSCIINGNSAAYYGGGIYCHEYNPTINNCTIAGNSAEYYGGGIYGCDGLITNCTVTDNSAGWEGGGLAWCYGSIADCTISGNATKSSGGGLFNCVGPITNCTISNNFAEYDGGGLWGDWDTIIESCIITGNSAHRNGGGITNVRTQIINCTVTGNSAEQYGGGIYYCDCSVTNCIIYNNWPEQIFAGPPTATVTYSDVQGGCPGLGNIDADPCFIELGYWDANGTPADANDDFWVDGDYHLKSAGWRWDIQRKFWTWDDVTSRCIDAGNPGSALADELLSIPDDPNNEWGHNLRIDMGAFGGTAEASIPPYDWALLADLTNDGIVTLEDYAYQAADWLNSADSQPGDLNRDGLIDIDDLALLTEDWLAQTFWH